MRYGRYENRTRTVKRGKYAGRRKLNKSFLVTLSVLLVLFAVAGGTVAYLTTNGGQAANRFVPGNVACSVDPDDRSITNTGNVDAYIRAAVVVNWMDSDGNVYALAPTYKAAANSGWVRSESDGYYYYIGTGTAGPSVSPQQTIVSPASITEVSNNPDSGVYALAIEVVAEAIQAEGMGAASAQDAWAAVTGED